MSALAAFFAQTVQGLLTTRYSELASSVIIIYDHLVTLDQEVELIWKSGWSFGKLLFLLNRYYTLFAVVFNNYVLFSNELTRELCVSWFRWQGVSGIIAFTLSELILQLRLYALYGLNKKVMALMGTVFAAAFVSSATIMGLALSRIEVTVLTLFDYSFCAPLNLAQITYFYAFWIPIIICESLLCALVLARALNGWKRKSTLLAAGRELVAVLVRDSVVYFLVLFAVYLTNTVIFVGGDVIKTEAAVNYAVSMSCVMGSRLCLNVRGVVWHDDEIVVARPPTLALPLHSARSRSRSASRARRSAVGTRSQTSTRSRSNTLKRPAVVFAQCSADSGGLSEYEMDELRTMRADQKARALTLPLRITGKGD